MKYLAIVLALFTGFSFLHAEEALQDFKFELSCTRIGVESPTIMIHAVITYDGDNNTCEAEKGLYLKGAEEAYNIDFKCQVPTQISKNKIHPLFTWVLIGPENPKDHISKLVIVLDHETKLANGFATSEDGISHSVTCKKW